MRSNEVNRAKKRLTIEAFLCFQLSLSYAHNHKHKRSNTHTQTNKQQNKGWTFLVFFSKPIKNKTKTQNFGKNVNRDLNENSLLEQKKPNPESICSLPWGKTKAFWIELEEKIVYFYIGKLWKKVGRRENWETSYWGCFIWRRRYQFLWRIDNLCVWNLMCNRRQVPRQLGDKSGRDGVWPS